MQPITKIFKKRLNSTNVYANSVISKSESTEPLWIRTDDQFDGKGQGNHSWLADPGKNLTGSLVVFPDNLVGADQFLLSMTYSLAALDFIGLFLEDGCIKWPNDLYVADRKIGGILIETAIMGTEVRYAILGIGMNINQETFSSDIPNPLSIKQITGIDYNISEMEDLFLEAVRNRLILLESGAKHKIKDEYLRKLYRFKEFAPYKADGKWFRARILDVTTYGHLVLESEAGIIREFAFQEVQYIT